MNTLSNIVSKYTERLFSIDFRALVVMRVGLGLALIIDLITRLPDVFAMYSDWGVVPRVDILSFWSSTSYVSVHLLSGSVWLQTILLLVQIVLAVFLVIGYRTRLATILSWFLLISLHFRLPIVLNGGDLLFRMLLFWGMFVPWGRYLSLDVALGRVKEIKTVNVPKLLSIGGIGLMLQGALMYFFTGILKNGMEWQTEFSAIYYALSHDQFVTGIGEWMLNFPELLHYLTAFVVYLEIVGPILLFIPIFTARIRILVFFLLLVMQIGMNAGMHNFGLFGFLSVIALLPYLPDRFFNWFGKVARSLGRRASIEIFYDTNCSFCQRLSAMIPRVLFIHSSTVSPASVDAEVEKKMLEENSWVVRIGGKKMYTSFDGVVVLVRHSPLFCIFTSILQLPGIYDIGEYLYRLVARKRLRMCMVKEEEKSPVLAVWTVLVNIFLVLAILFVVISNVKTLDKEKYADLIPTPVLKVSATLHINQSFSMFAPYPTKSDGWYMTIGTHPDGTQSNVFTGSGKLYVRSTDKEDGLDFNKPENVSKEFKNNRWWRYFSNLYKPSYKYFRTGYLKYVCREWNKENTGDDRFISAELLYVHERTLLDYEVGPPTRDPLKIITCPQKEN